MAWLVSTCFSYQTFLYYAYFFLNIIDATSFHTIGSSASNYNLFHASHTLLMVVYRRDCRRPFAPKDHWLVKDVKSSLLVSELERGRQSVQVILFRSIYIPVPHEVIHCHYFRLTAAPPENAARHST